ncbi:MAG: phosphatase PAP2 family protein [Candidatus Paceibacterales bacterium]
MKHQHFQLILFVLYITLVTLLMTYMGIGITLDRYAVILWAGAFLIHHNKHFIHDFSPFVLLLIAHDFLRGFADDINHHVHFLEPINVTKFFFNGHIPTIELQNKFYTPGILHWYDYAAAFLYLIHFAVPLLFAFYLWNINKKYFREYMLALVILSYAGFLSYILYPTAPPWLAAKMGFLPPITKILDVVLQNFPQRINLPTIYGFIGPNLVAAIPSMHAAYTFLTFLFSVRFFKLKGFIFFPYVLSMWLTIVYLGEHYFIDIVVGVIYCLVVFGISPVLIKNYHKFFKEIEDEARPVLKALSG